MPPLKVVVIHLRMLVLNVDSSNRNWNNSVLSADVLAGILSSEIIKDCKHNGILSIS